MTPSKHVRPEDIEAINTASNFTELFTVAERILGRMPQGVAGICDPISTSPTSAGPAKKDPETLFAKTTRVLIENNYVVFDDRPFFKKIAQLKDPWFQENPDKRTCSAIVEQFFKPLLATKKIITLLLLPDWELFYVPYWEEGHAKDYGIRIVRLPSTWAKSCDVGLLTNFKLTTEPSEQSGQRENA